MKNKKYPVFLIMVQMEYISLNESLLSLSKNLLI